MMAYTFCKTYVAILLAWLLLSVLVRMLVG